MIDTKDVLQWLDELSSQALTDAREGNTILANRIGQQPALKHYFDNVHCIKTVNPLMWTQYYPAYIQEATRLYGEYVQGQEAAKLGSKVTSLEAKFDELATQLKGFIESQAPVVESEDPPKRKPGRSAKLVANDTDTPTDEPETVAPESA